MGDLFEIKKTLSFNSEDLKVGSEYDYITRTSQNQGILQKTGFINKKNINSAGNWSLGLLQMNFFYRNKPWYAGQFVRKIIPKIRLNNNIIINFFTATLNKLKPKLLTLAVRQVEETFLNTEIQLPTKNGKIDFDFMEKFIKELEKEKIKQVDNYLEKNGLKNYKLTSEEEKVLKDFEDEKFEWGEFNYEDIGFNLLTVKNKLSKSNLENGGKIPIYSSESTNNGIIGYTKNNAEFIVSEQNPIYLIFGDHTRSFNIATNNFCVADNVKVISVGKNYDVKKLLSIIPSWKKCIPNKGYSRHWSLAKSAIFQLPTKNNKPDYGVMEILISAVKKIVVRDVVKYVEERI